jgi:maltooligosyltrehalose synthase
MTSLPLTGVYLLPPRPEPSSAWADYLRALGLGAVALSGATEPAGHDLWQSLGFTTTRDDHVEREFAILLAQLFSAAESDDEYAAIFRDFTDRPTDDHAPGETGLLVRGPLAHSGAVKRFHEAAEWRAEHDFAVPLPGLVQPASTHARLLAAVGDPTDWRGHVMRWKEYAREVRSALGDDATPSLEAEYRLYQRLLVAWPAIPSDFTDAERAFVTALFESDAGRLFRKSFVPFADALIQRAATLSLAAVVLQCTAPGVPQLGDGEELGTDAPLTDRVRLLAETGAHPADLIDHWQDGRLRLFVVRTLLGLRARVPALFGKTKYLAQKARGRFADHCVVFTRQCPGYVLLVAVPRFAPPATELPTDGDWEKTALEICGIMQIHWTNVLTGAEATGPYIALSEAFRHLPVAVFLAKTGDAA